VRTSQTKTTVGTNEQLFAKKWVRKDPVTTIAINWTWDILLKDQKMDKKAKAVLRTRARLLRGQEARLREAKRRKGL
jgi:hypothetical protein